MMNDVRFANDVFALQTLRGCAAIIKRRQQATALPCMTKIRALPSLSKGGWHGASRDGRIVLMLNNPSVFCFAKSSSLYTREPALSELNLTLKHPYKLKFAEKTAHRGVPFCLLIFCCVFVGDFINDNVENILSADLI